LQEESLSLLHFQNGTHSEQWDPIPRGTSPLVDPASPCVFSYTHNQSARSCGLIAIVKSPSRRPLNPAVPKRAPSLNRDVSQHYQANLIKAMDRVLQEQPAKYSEQGLAWIRGGEQVDGGITGTRNVEEIAILYMTGVGIPEEEITRPMVDRAVAAHKAFMTELEEIKRWQEEGNHQGNGHA
jgi:hypothetical protein